MTTTTALASFVVYVVSFYKMHSLHSARVTLLWFSEKNIFYYNLNEVDKNISRGQHQSGVCALQSVCGFSGLPACLPIFCRQGHPVGHLEGHHLGRHKQQGTLPLDQHACSSLFQFLIYFYTNIFRISGTLSSKQNQDI